MFREDLNDALQALCMMWMTFAYFKYEHGVEIRYSGNSCTLNEAEEILKKHSLLNEQNSVIWEKLG